MAKPPKKKDLIVTPDQLEDLTLVFTNMIELAEEFDPDVAEDIRQDWELIIDRIYEANER